MSCLFTAVPDDENSSTIEDRVSGENSNSNWIIPSVDESLSQSHTSRNFVVTPPQTESAQILLALARSCSKKQYFQSAESVTGSGAPVLTPNLETINNQDYNCDLKTNEKVVEDDDTLFDSECDSIDRHLPTSISSHEDYEVESASNAAVNKQLTSVTNNLPLASTVITTTSAAPSLSASSVIADETIVPENKSLLAKLLTRNSVPSQYKVDDIVHYDENCKLLYEPSTQATTPISTMSGHQSDGNSKKNTFELQSDILECPFLIETNDGYVDMAVDNMLNVFDNTEIFDSCIGKTSTLKIVTPKIECLNTNDTYKHCDQVSETNCCDYESKIESFEDDILERIKQEEDEDELKDDPDAVVLRRINENGQLEKYILSSTDIAALKVMIEQRKQLANVNSTSVKTDTGITADAINIAANSASIIQTTATMSTSTSISTSHVEVVLPSTRGSTSLITRVINAGIKVENAISKLPFKKSRSSWTSEISTCDSTSNNSISNINNSNSSNTISNGSNSANNDGNSNNNSSSNDTNRCCSRNNITSTVIPSTSVAVSSCSAGVNGTSSEYVSSVGGNSERILDGTSLTVNSHHHENMFEELDNQLNMVDCSMENIQREYVAYEEASKNETQIDHNYYANAMKDEDEECVVISDNFNLGSVMLIDESLEDATSAGFVSLSHTVNKRPDTSNSLALSLPKNCSDKMIPVTAVGDNKHDLYLDKCSDAGDSSDNNKKLTGVAISAVDTTVTTPSRRNGFVNKVVPLSVSVPVSTMTESMPSIPMSIFNEKCGLIVNNDVLMDSVTNTTIMTATTTVAHAMITSRSNSVTTTSATSTASTIIKAQYTPSKPSICSIVATTINSVSVGTLTPHTTAVATFSNMSAVTKTKPSVVNGLSSTFKSSTGFGGVKRKSRNHSLENGRPITLPFKKVKNSTTNSTDLCSTTTTAAITSATTMSTAAVQIARKGRRAYRRKLSLSNDNTDYECVKKSKEFSNSNLYINMNTNVDGDIFYEPITTNNNLIEEIIVDEIS